MVQHKRKWRIYLKDWQNKSVKSFDWSATREALLADGTIIFLGEQLQNIFAITVYGRLLRSKPHNPPLIINSGQVTLLYDYMIPID